MINQELFTYIQKSIEAGHSIENIKQSLIKEGWEEKEVDRVITEVTESKSSKEFEGVKAPLPVKIIGGLIYLTALSLFLFGILSLLFAPILGIILIGLGVFLFRYTRYYIQMKHKGYLGIIYLTIVSTAVILYRLFPFKIDTQQNYLDLVSILFNIIVILYSYSIRQKFVN